MKKKGLVLSEADRAALEEIVKKGKDWRMRHRAQTLLYFSEGRMMGTEIFKGQTLR